MQVRHLTEQLYSVAQYQLRSNFSQVAQNGYTFSGCSVRWKKHLTFGNGICPSKIILNHTVSVHKPLRDISTL